MPRRPTPLPAALSGRPFTVGEGADNGLSETRMRASDLTAPFHGVRAAGELDLLGRCRARATRLPAFAAFSHTTAAALDGAPLPLSLQDEAHVHISVPAGARAPSGRGTRGHQVTCSPQDADRRHGVLATSPARTFCDLAEILTLVQLVAVGDYYLHSRRATWAQLTDAVSRHVGRRGRGRLLDAVELLDARAESPKESELRVVLHQAGLAAEAVNHVIRDPLGHFVARVDLAYLHARVATEYDGDYHRDRQQWRRDHQRRRRLEALGWTVIIVTQADLDEPASLLDDLRTALRAASCGNSPLTARV